MDQLVKNGEVRRGRVGLETKDVTPDLAKALKVGANTPCAVITNVEPDSPAEKAGLKPRDVIISVNGKPIRGSFDVRNRIGLVPVGEKVEFKYLRGGATKTAKVKVERPYQVLGASGESLPQLGGAAVSNSASIQAARPGNMDCARQILSSALIARSRARFRN